MSDRAKNAIIVAPTEDDAKRVAALDAFLKSPAGKEWTKGKQQADGISLDLIKAMAMDAGKSLCAYIEVMFPEIWHGSKSGFKISMKHHVYNDIMALADLHDETAIRLRLAANEAHRKEWVGAYRKMRRNK